MNTPESLLAIAKGSTKKLESVIEDVEKYMLDRASRGFRDAIFMSPSDVWCADPDTLKAVGDKYIKAGFIVFWLFHNDEKDGIRIVWGK